MPLFCGKSGTNLIVGHLEAKEEVHHSPVYQPLFLLSSSSPKCDPVVLPNDSA